MEGTGLFITKETEKYQLRDYFQSGATGRGEPLFAEFSEYLSILNIPAELVAFDTHGQQLKIYLKDDSELALLNQDALDITDYELGHSILDKWRELAIQFNYLQDLSENIEVKIQNFTDLYVINLAEISLETIISRLYHSEIKVKPCEICISDGKISLVYPNLGTYENSISSGSVFRVMDLIDSVMEEGDVLGLYRPKSVKLEVLYLEEGSLDDIVQCLPLMLC